MKTLVERELSQIDAIIKRHKNMLKRIEREPNTLSSEAGILTPIKALKDRHQKALRHWERHRKKRIRELKKLGFEKQIQEYLNRVE